MLNICAYCYCIVLDNELYKTMLNEHTLYGHKLCLWKIKYSYARECVFK